MKQSLLDALGPLIDFLDTLDPSDPSAAAALNATFPVEGEAMQSIAALFEKGVSEKWLCDREGGPKVSYSRVAKKLGSTELSVDAVRMAGPGPGHTHPQGEFDLSFTVSGNARFDGHPQGWVVYPPMSWHVPTVSEGTMNILYFLPGGAIQFGPRAE